MHMHHGDAHRRIAWAAARRLRLAAVTSITAAAAGGGAAAHVQSVDRPPRCATIDAAARAVHTYGRLIYSWRILLRQQ